MNNEFVLARLGDAGYATLHELTTALAAFANADPVTEVLISRCEEKTKAIEAALRAGEFDTLVRYVQVMQDVVRLCRDTPVSGAGQARAAAAAASQSLANFFQEIKAKRPISELVLFQDYQRLGGLLSRTLSPLDLWPVDETNRCLHCWTESNFAVSLQLHAEHRLSCDDARSIDLAAIDTLVLTLIRGQDAGAATTLQRVCDWRGLEAQNTQHLVYASLLSAIVQVFAKGGLEIDVFLKRYLLSSLVWLTSGVLDEALLHESTFFAYLAWQATRENGDDQLGLLAHLAQAANWQVQKGTRYNRPFAFQQKPNSKAMAQQAIATTKQVWSNFCASTQDSASYQKYTDVALSFAAMGETLEVLYPEAKQLTLAFLAIVSHEKRRVVRNVQIEIATVLLILSAMLTDMSLYDDAQTELHLTELVRRLHSLKEEQATDALAPWMIEPQRRDWLLALVSTTEQLIQQLDEIQCVLERSLDLPCEGAQWVQHVSKLQQIKAIADTLKLDGVVNAIKPIEEKMAALVQSKQSIDTSTQKKMVEDIAGLALTLSKQATSLREHQPLQVEHAIEAPPTAFKLHLPPADFLDLSVETQIKTIGDLQISIALYQAYLNETDIWSRQLVQALSEWVLDPTQPLHGEAMAWAHALAGSSGTIGFKSCAELAKLLERLILRIQEQGLYTSELPQLLAQAAEEIRHLLHQFAAGFLKAANPLLIKRLQTSAELASGLIATEVIAAFEEESEQLIAELGAALRIWNKEQALRSLHTLKGSARLVGEQALSGLAHQLETQIESINESPQGVELIQILNDYDQLVALTHRQNILIAPLPYGAAKVSSNETTRVPTNAIHRMVDQTGALIMARTRMDAQVTQSLRTTTGLGEQVQRLRDQLREMELQIDSQMQSRKKLNSEIDQHFDPLEFDKFTRTQELARFMAEALSDIATLQRSLQRSLNSVEDDLSTQLHLTRDLTRHLQRACLIEFDSAAERLHRVVRMTSQELGKSCELVIQNGSQAMDRSVLERMIPAFEHLLRNAVVHGIERPLDRKALGKPEQGIITLRLTQKNNDVIVSLQDDGHGVDHAALLSKARKKLNQPNFKADAAELIFMLGISTANEVSELAGRGIGMDVVRSQVLALGGRIEVASTQNKGTCFKLVLPMTTTVTQIVLVRTGSHITGIPGHLVSAIVRIKPSQIVQARQSKTVTHDEQTHPFFKLDRLLQYSPQEAQLEQSTHNVIFLQSAEQTIALQVDEVIGNQEVMLKNLGAQLSQMPGLTGMTVLPTGATALIYNPVALAAIYGARPESDYAAAQDSPKAPLVLIVDDSITMRRVLQRLLLREGYRVAVAADGLQALELLRLELPTLILCDVEMPHMDGFELLRNIRSTAAARLLPVVMITSRIANKHRDHAKELGANDYLGKPYSEDELLQVLKRYSP